MKRTKEKMGAKTKGKNGSKDKGGIGNHGEKVQ
jgi:hypothetical protein